MTIDNFIAEEQKSSFFNKAMEYLDEGLYEEACDCFSALVGSFPDDRGIWLQYQRALRRAREYEKADEIVTHCHHAFPDDVGFLLEWTRCFDARADWNECLRRRREALGIYNPRNDIRFLPLVVECFLPLVETRRFQELKVLVEGYWDLLLDSEQYGASIYYALENLGDYKRQVELCNRRIEQAGATNPVIENVNYSNLKSIALSALWNQESIKSRSGKVSVLSIGQNCLPYTIANRWGLLSYQNASDVTVFDLGAFGHNTSAVALNSDFSSFLEPENYIERPDVMGAPQMHHRPTGVHFGHERGRTIIGKNGESFHHLIRRKIETFRTYVEAERVLLVYGIVGGVDISAFVSEMKSFLEKKNAHLLIVNFTREDLDCPEEPRVSYEHIPFPVDYNWNDIEHFTSDRGVSFDLRFTRAIEGHIDMLLSENS